MKHILITASIFALSAVGANAQTYLHGQQGNTYQNIGNSTYGSDGTTHQRIGNTTFGSDGSTSQRIGNTNFNSDGSTSQQIGNTLFNSDGSTVQRIGNTTFGSDGTTCQKIGSSTFCNWISNSAFQPTAYGSGWTVPLGITQWGSNDDYSDRNSRYFAWRPWRIF